MPLVVSRTKAAIFTLFILLFFLILAEFVCLWEEQLQESTTPSLLEYQQIPQTFFKRQNLISNNLAWRTVGLTWAYQSLPLNKPEGQLRIGVLGASATAGFGYSQTWSFPGILQRLCDATGKNVQVINLSRIGYSSRQLQTLAYKAINELSLDHLIVYAGNNEFLELNARLSTGKDLENKTAQAQGLLSKSALYRTLHRWIFKATKTTAIVQDKMPTPTALPEGVRDVIKSEYITNLSNIVQMAKGKCDITLCTVAANLMFGPTGKEPFCLSPEGDEKWQYLQQAMAFEKLGRTEKSKAAWAKATLIAPKDEKDVITLLASDESAMAHAEKVIQHWKDNPGHTPTEPELYALALAAKRTNNPEVLAPHFAHYVKKHAGTYEGEYWLGRIAYVNGDEKAAIAKLSAARNKDIRRISIPSDFNEAIRELAAQKQVPLVDVDQAGLWNYNHFNDNCHFNLDGNLVVAKLLYQELFGQETIQVGSVKKWLANRESDFLEPWQWIGVDDEIWRVYQIRPNSIHDKMESARKGNSVQENFWYSNRLYYTWAGANQGQFSEMEQGYQSGLNTDFDRTARQALQFLYQSEAMKKQAAQYGGFPPPAPFPGN